MDEATNQFGDGKSMIIWVLMEVIVAKSRKRKWGTVSAILGLSLILPYLASTRTRGQFPERGGPWNALIDWERVTFNEGLVASEKFTYDGS